MLGYHKRHFKWHNTNFLLGRKGYNGIKTGITEAAGPCLSASYNEGGYRFIVVLLSAQSMEARWEEVPQLVEWALKYQKTVNNFKYERE